MKIQLLHGRAIVLDKEIHTISANEALAIPIKSDTAYSNMYAVCIINGKKNTFKVFDNVLEIPPEHLSSGELLITFQQIKDGKVLNTWLCEKITLKEAEGAYEPIPEIVTIREEMRVLRNYLEETKEYFKGICEGYDIV